MAARNSQSEHKLDEAMVHILDGMLERDETITARSVAAVFKIVVTVSFMRPAPAGRPFFPG